MVTDQGDVLDPSDAELVADARRGARDAVESLIRRHQGVVFRYVMSMLRDPDRSSDVSQDTFLKALRNLDRFRGDSSFRTWLLSIARREALGALRSERGQRCVPLEGHEVIPGSGSGPDAHAIQSDEVRRIRAALDRLPEKQRSSVSLRLFDGLSFREIGEVIGSSEGAARVNYHYGINRLREWLHE